MSHTKEPWAVDRYGDVRDSEGRPVGLYRPKNKARIVAAVNACKGIPTETLETDPFNNVVLHFTEKQLAEARADEATRLLGDCLRELRFVRVFVTSRERIKRPEGGELYDALVARVSAFLDRPK